jgi:hypothetical protein
MHRAQMQPMLGNLFLGFLFDGDMETFFVERVLVCEPFLEFFKC